MFCVASFQPSRIEVSGELLSQHTFSREFVRFLAYFEVLRSATSYITDPFGPSIVIGAIRSQGLGVGSLADLRQTRRAIFFHERSMRYSTGSSASPTRDVDTIPSAVAMFRPFSLGYCGFVLTWHRSLLLQAKGGSGRMRVSFVRGHG